MCSLDGYEQTISGPFRIDGSNVKYFDEYSRWMLKRPSSKTAASEEVRRYIPSFA
jgi:hypothetical protein